MKIAVVTGASSGMGREFVKQISMKYRTIEEIWIISRRVSRLEQLKEEITNVNIRVIPCDVTKEEDIETYKKLLEEHKPSIRLLVNSAGFGMIGHFGDVPEKETVGMCDLNCTALTRFTYISLPYMIDGCSNIINFASAAAFLPQPSFAVYAATKSYVLSLSIALNKELLGRGIAVTAVCPGPVETEFFDVAERYHEVKMYKKMFRAKASKVVELALIDAYHQKPVSVYGLSMNGLRLLTNVFPPEFLVKFIG